MKINKKTIKLSIITIISIILIGLSLSLLTLIDFGNDPFTYMNLAISSKLNISLGTWQLILNIILFIPVLICGRKHIGLGTIFNMVFVGYSIDLFTWIFNTTGFYKIFEVFWVRLIFLIPTILLFAISVATYISTDLGTSPYDAIPFLVEKITKKIPFKIIRIVYDLLYVLIGFIFTGQIKIATILMALFIGEAITLIKSKFFSEKKVSKSSY